LRRRDDPVADRLIPLEPLDLCKIGSIDDLVRAMSKTAFTGRQLGEAADVLEAMEADPVVQQAIGEYLSSLFLEIKSPEWRTYLEHVGNWEVDSYLDL